MERFEITTNHKVAHAIKQCFESRIYRYENSHKMKLMGMSVYKGHVIVYIECLKDFEPKNIFFLGMNAEMYKDDLPNLKFDAFGLLPLERANELLKLTPVNV